MKTNQIRTSKVYSELAIAIESAIITGILAEDQRQAGAWESKRAGFRGALMGGCGHGEAVGELTSTGASHMTG